MLNEGALVAEEQLKVLHGVELTGDVNVEDAILLEQVRSAIRRGHPQIRTQAPQPDRVALVGGGPSLAATESDLRDLVFEGAKLVTVNGAYHWCRERNLQSKMQIVMDARAHNARFVVPYTPNCRYALASQCHPAVFDAVADYPDVWIFHAAAGADEPAKALLDEYYAGQWLGIGGGTTVVMRSLFLLRMIGFLRIDLFGVDSCYLNGVGHAYEQPENARDRRIKFNVEPPGRPELRRVFECAPWHLKQAEDFLQYIKINGDTLQLRVHGDGLLSFIIEAEGDVALPALTTV